MKDENDCDNHCPLNCANDQIQVHYKPDADCCDIPYCLPIVNMSCPLTANGQGASAGCLTDTEFECPRNNEIDGCPDVNYCIPKWDKNGCHLPCPIICQKDEVYCYGTPDESGCFNQGFCATAHTAACPASCPIAPCPYSYMMSNHKGFDENSCDLGYECIPLKSMYKDLSACHPQCNYVLTFQCSTLLEY